MNEYDEHECDHDEDVSKPNWRWSWWDIGGLALTTVAGFFGVVNQGLNLMAQEFGAAANFQRQRADLREAVEEHEANQRRLAEDLNRMIDGGGS